MLAELRVDAKLVREALVRSDALDGQLDSDPVGVLVADATAGQGTRARAHRVSFEDRDAAEATPGQVIGSTGPHDAGTYDDDVRVLGHRLSRCARGAPLRSALQQFLRDALDVGGLDLALVGLHDIAR